MNQAAGLINTTPVFLDPVRGPQRAILILVTLAATILLLFFIWAGVSHLDITAKGEGSVVPSTHIQLVQNLEGGILRDVLVREGDHVTKDEVVAKIDATDATSSYREDLSTYNALLGTAARLEAETSKHPLAFPDDLKNADGGKAIMASERSLFESRQSELQDAVTVFQRQEEKARQTISDRKDQLVHLRDKKTSLASEHKLVAAQVRQGLMSVVEKLRLERQIAETEEEISKANGEIRGATLLIEELESRIAERRSGFISEAREELSKTNAKLAALAQRLVVHRDKVGRREVRAPVNGIVKRVATFTSGAVIEPGGTIMEIVPMDDTLYIEARISPSDIAFIHEGQEAKVRMTAYDVSVYGALKGRVERVGADTVITREGARYYPVTIRVEQDALKTRQQHLSIIPGMVAEVSIVTGSRTILGYLLKPVLKLKENALQER